MKKIFQISRWALLTCALLAPALGCAQLSGGSESGENAAQPPAEQRSAELPTSEPAQNVPGSTKDLKITQVATWTRDGYLFIYAVLENHSDKWLKVAANITLYDKDGKELKSGAIIGKALAPAYPGNVAPGGWAILEHFEELSDIQGGAYDHFEFTSMLVEEKEPSPQLEVSNSKFDQGTPWANFSGTVTNKGTQPCLDPIVIAVGYNAEGKIFSTQWTGSDDAELAPGQSWDFADSLDNPNGEVQKIVVIAGCGMFHD